MLTSTSGGDHGTDGQEPAPDVKAALLGQDVEGERQGKLLGAVVYALSAAVHGDAVGVVGHQEEASGLAKHPLQGGDAGQGEGLEFAEVDGGLLAEVV